jgi:hypothetical protein
MGQLMWVRMLPSNNTEDVNGGVGTAEPADEDPKGQY